MEGGWKTPPPPPSATTRQKSPVLIGLNQQPDRNNQVISRVICNMRFDTQRRKRS